MDAKYFKSEDFRRELCIFPLCFFIAVALLVISFLLASYFPLWDFTPDHLRSDALETVGNQNALPNNAAASAPDDNREETLKFDAIYRHEGFITALSVLMLTFSFAGTWWYYSHQERRDYKFKEGEFLTTLGNKYISKKRFEKIYNLCDRAFALRHYKPCSAEDTTLDDIERDLRQLCRKDYALVSNYLSFFEVFIVLVRKRVIGIESFDDLFGYRFLLVARNAIIREYTMEHAQRRGYFHNIIELEEQWLKFRHNKFKNNGKVDPFHVVYFAPSIRYCNESDAKQAFDMRANVVETNIVNQQQELLLIDNGIKTFEEFSQYFKTSKDSSSQKQNSSPFVRGIFKKDKLVAYIIVSFRPQPLNEYFDDTSASNDNKRVFQNSRAYIELVIVEPTQRDNNYQKALLIDVQDILKDRKISFVGAIVSPKNYASYKSFIEEGYIVNREFIHEPEGYHRVSVLKDLRKEDLRKSEYAL